MAGDPLGVRAVRMCPDVELRLDQNLYLPNFTRNRNSIKSTDLPFFQNSVEKISHASGK